MPMLDSDVKYRKANYDMCGMPMLDALKIVIAMGFVFQEDRIHSLSALIGACATRAKALDRLEELQGRIEEYKESK